MCRKWLMGYLAIISLLSMKIQHVSANELDILDTNSKTTQFTLFKSKGGPLGDQERLGNIAKGLLPKTGEARQAWLFILGVILLILVVIIIYLKKKKGKSL